MEVGRGEADVELGVGRVEDGDVAVVGGIGDVGGPDDQAVGAAEEGVGELEVGDEDPCV